MDHEHDKCFNQQPVVNWKCIYFTLALAGGYWFLPPRNKWVLLALLYFPYLVLAWYDHWYQCKRNMGPTYLSAYYWWAKPQDSEQIKQYKNWCPEIKSKVLKVDIVIGIILLAIMPYFYYWKPN